MSERQFREYERKRDFGKTAEPALKKRRKKEGALWFVVQEHSAGFLRGGWGAIDQDLGRCRSSVLR